LRFQSDKRASQPFLEKQKNPRTLHDNRLFLTSKERGKERKWFGKEVALQ
jgi:hypothetical protein